MADYTSRSQTSAALLKISKYDDQDAYFSLIISSAQNVLCAHVAL